MKMNTKEISAILKQAYNHEPWIVNDKIIYEYSFSGCSKENYPIGGINVSSTGISVYEIHQYEDEGELIDQMVVTEYYHFTRKQKAEVARILRFWKKRYSIFEKVSKKDMRKASNYTHLEGEQQEEYARENNLKIVKPNNDNYLDYLKKVIIENNFA